MVGHSVEAKFFFHKGAFRWTSRNPDGPGTLDTCDLADQRPDRAARCCDHNRLAGSGTTDFEQASVSH
jgi:hypothetical protein